MKATHFQAGGAGALRKAWRQLLAWAPAFGCLFFALQAAGQTFECNIQPKSADNFTVAEFRFYLPPGVDPVRGVAILVPGHNEDGRSLIDKDGWKDFASRNKVGLLACHFEDDDSRDYSDANRGSGRAVIQVLRDLEIKTGQRGLGQTNYMVYGISSGAQFAASMTLVKPDRMFGFASLIGAVWQRPDTASRKIPGLYISAADQPNEASAKTSKYVLENRALGANWSLLQTESVDVVVQNMVPLAQSHLEASMGIRQRAEALPGGKLENLSPVDGWVVRYGGGQEEILAAADLPRTGMNSSFWFPARNTAELWLSLKQKFGKK